MGCSSRVSSNCDEIREEKTNKTLIVGLYRTKIIVPAVPGIVPEILTLEGGTLGEDRHWIRFIDKDDRTYVVFEFNGDFDILSEMRVDSLEWEGEDFFGSRWR